ncbi:MAG: hypothetical protein ABJA79_03605 [Parafilimonas sp.]
MRTILIFVLCLSAILCAAQEFGGTPPTVNWKQINTDTARIIFPQPLDSTANRIASIVHELQKNYSAAIGNKIRKINIVLQPDATISNGYVALAPYRSEFFLMPPQNASELGAQSWTDNLAIHEFRHVQQYSNFNVGLSKAMSVLFGENGQALANAASVPDWFFEGDAVYNETMLSRQGRGRLPSFFNGYRSLYKEGKNYNYMQLRNGSYKNYIPNHYELGYLLVAYGREKYGNDFWLKVTHDAASFKPLFYPLQGAIKKYAGKSYEQFVKDAFTFYHKQWNEDKSASPEWITPAEKNNTINYQYAYPANDGSLVVLKNSYKNIPAFYKINADKTETKIAVRDIAYDNYYSYNNGKIVFAAYQPDIRWGNRNYSVIKILDIHTGKEKKITSHTKYFSPGISHGGKMIATVEITSDQKCNLILLDETGSVKQSWSNSSNIIYSYPKFSGDDNFLYVMIRNNAGEMGIEKRNIADGSVINILPLKNRILGFPVVQGDTLIYTCSNNGRDEIWAYINSQNKQYRLASYSTGLYQGVITNDGSLAASAFTAEGYRLAKFSPQWQSVNEAADTLINLFVTKPFNQNANNLLASLPSKNYAAAKYSKLSHPFNFHSWSPYFEYPDYSVIVYGENVLNTLQSQLYYTYNSNEKYSRAGLTEIYGGWYVQPFIDVNETWNRNIPINTDTALTWNEFNASAGLQLPLNFSAGKQYRRLLLSTSYNTNAIQFTGIAKQFFSNNNFSYLQARIIYAEQMQQALQQIYPHWAVSLLLQYRGSVNKNKAHQLLINRTMYLPGLANSHNLVINTAYQSRDTAGNYFFTNNFPISRGYEALDFPRMFKLGANYHFPLFYPDWGFANITYFNRIRANLFYDYTTVKSLRSGNKYEFNSLGAEIYFDTRWWNQQPIVFGIRYSRLIDYKLAGLQPNRWDLILPVTFF